MSFIEVNNNNYENLCQEIKKFQKQNTCDDWLKIEKYNDEFANVIENILNKYRKNVSPAFFFLDPFGFSGVPLKIIKRLLEYPKTEVFITFMTRDVNRFLNSPPHQTAIQELFGCRDVREKLNQEPYRQLTNEQAILKLYRNQLHDEANVKYTFPFQVKADSNLQTVYYLIHCTNHPLGCELMKAIMYSSGTPGQFGYFGPADGQLSLEFFYGVENLKKYLYKRFENRQISFKDIRYETLMETSFIPKHYRKALKELERENRISIRGKGPRQGLNDNSLIIFRKNRKILFDY